MVVNTLSHMTMCCVSHVEEANKYVKKDVHRFARFDVRSKYSPNGGLMVDQNSESLLVVEVKSKQHLNQPLIELKESVIGKFNDSFSLGGMVS